MSGPVGPNPGLGIVPPPVAQAEPPGPWRIAEGKTVPYEEAEADNRPQVFIQWKGTDVCFDFRCDCGAVGHFDGYSAYQFACPGCGRFFGMPHTVYLVPMESADLRCAPPVALDINDE